MIRRLVPFDGPVRLMAVATLLTTIGTGLWYSSWAIFFTRSVGLSPDELGIGITVAGVIGLLAATPVGRLADRVGPREVLMVVTTVQGAAVAAYTLVHSFTGFFAVAVVAIVAERSYLGVRMALVTGLVDGDADDPADREALQRRRLDVLAYLRAVNHVGYAVGAALAVVVLTADTRPVYVAMVLLNAATFFAYVAILRWVPRVPPARTRASAAAVTGEAPVAVVRDVPYLAITALSSVLALCWGMLSSGVPLWITHHTEAPTWMAAVIVFLNAVGVALFQRRASRGTDDPMRAARVAARSAVILALSCAAFAASYHGSGALVIAVLVAAALVHVTGELLYAASAWGLSIGLMPDHAHGEYQGMFAAGTAAVQMVAPALMMLLVVEWGVTGWFVLGGLFLAAGLPTVAVTRWATRARSPAARPTAPALT